MEKTNEDLVQELDMIRLSIEIIKKKLDEENLKDRDRAEYENSLADSLDTEQTLIAILGRKGVHVS